jgi:hypothetical protein
MTSERESNGEKNRLRTVAYSLFGLLMAVNAWAVKDYIVFKIDQATFRVEQKVKDRQQDEVADEFRQAFKRHERILCALAHKAKAVVAECEDVTP